MSRSDKHLVPAAELADLAVHVLTEVGAPPRTAELVGHSLMQSNLVGHDSHGVRRLSSYAEAVRDGRIDPGAQPTTRVPHDAAITVDGRRAFGQLSAHVAVDEVRSAAAEHGVASASITQCNHVGRLGEYVSRLAEDGLVALMFCNADPTVAPLGGRERRLGTNPMAWGIPRSTGAPPVVMDWATSAIAEGKLAMARVEGQSVSPGQVLDAYGNESTDPADFYQGGALMPFGSHKGYGLGVLIELVGGLLSQAGISSLPGYDGSFGTVLVGLNIGRFVPLENFREQAELFCSELSGTPKAAGHHEVLVPGEPEERTRRQRAEEGIPVPHETWQELQALLRGATSAS